MTLLTEREWAVEVDTALAAFWKAEERLAQEYQWAKQGVFRAASLRPVGEATHRHDKTPEGTLAEALAEAKRQADLPSGHDDRTYNGFGAKKALEKFEAAKAALAEIKAAQEEFNEAYADQRWNRAFLVLNTNGHVHSSRACSTCFSTTQYGWLPQLSGADEAYIVEQAGESACTVCFPSAPVASLSQPRRAFHETEIEAQERKAAKAAEKAAKDAAKAAKAAANDLGTTVVLADAAWDKEISTVPKAKSFLTDGAAWKWDHPYYLPADRDAVAAALAAKNGTTPEDEIAAAAKRAAKRK